MNCHRHYCRLGYERGFRGDDRKPHFGRYGVRSLDRGSRLDRERKPFLCHRWLRRRLQFGFGLASELGTFRPSRMFRMFRLCRAFSALG
jgi:hypothetical protein